MSRRYLTCAETAKLLRAALAESFPGVKFSVKSRTYSGGASIDIGWTDGPNADDVKTVSAAFEGAYFDGMIDYKGDKYHTLDGQEVSFGADYIFLRHELTDAEVARGISEVAAAYGGCQPITVAEYRNGGAHSWRNSGGCDLGRALNLWMAGKREASFLPARQGMPAKQSATLARVAFAGSDEYGAPYGSRGYSRAA